MTLTQKETEALLVLFKDFAMHYNAHSLSKKLGITPRGTLKILKNLQHQRLLTSKKFGKAVFYKVNLEDYYTFRTLETLLIAEARKNAARWLSEFKDLFPEVHIAIIFGSILRDPEKAHDIDLLLVFTQNKLEKVKHFIAEKNKVLLKPVHPVMQSPQDLKMNLKKNDPVVLQAVARGQVLAGYTHLMEAVKDVTGF